jgi:hypothetical protein
VASRARNIPPVKAETSANTDIMLSSNRAPPLLAAGDCATSRITTGPMNE